MIKELLPYMRVLLVQTKAPGGQPEGWDISPSPRVPRGLRSGPTKPECTVKVPILTQLKTCMFGWNVYWSFNKNIVNTVLMIFFINIFDKSLNIQH